MSLSNIKTQLVALEGTITGVTRAYADRPTQAPVDGDCPVVINDYDPANFLAISITAGGLVRYSWRFNIKFLLHAVAQSTIEEWDDSIELYPARFIEKFLGNLTLSGNAVDQDLTSAFKIGLVEYKNSIYFGFTLPWTINEDIPTQIVA